MADDNGNNGELGYESMTFQDKLDLLLETTREINERLQEIGEVQNEIVEKLVNLSLPGPGYDIRDFDN